MDDDREILLVAIFTTITIGLWIFFELVKTTRTSTISLPMQQSVSPLSPKLDTETLNTINERDTFN